MNYTSLNVINSSLRDTTIIPDPCHLLRLTINTHPMMMMNHQTTSTIATTNNDNNDLMNAFLMKYNHRSTISHLNCTNYNLIDENLKNNNINNNNNDKIDNNIKNVKNNNQISNNNNNKIQLNFSVDRLLANENPINYSSHNCDKIQINNDEFNNDRNCNNKNTECDCYQLNNNDNYCNKTFSLSMDKKSIIRPTPVRISNGNNHVNSAVINQLPSISPFPDLSRILKYQLPQTVNNFKTLTCNGTRQTSIRSSNLSGTETNQITTQNGVNNHQTNGITSSGKRKRSWSRAVFSNLQRKGLEIQFQQQKYITKPDRRKLAARLNLTDAQVKVWFQNRRMKWRHTRENLKSGQEKTITEDVTRSNESSSSEDEIDVVTE